MKKILSVIALAAIMGSSALAGELIGTIERLVTKDNGEIVVRMNEMNKIIASDNNAKKEMYATLLTAQSSAKTVKILYAEGIISAVTIYTVPPVL